MTRRRKFSVLNFDVAFSSNIGMWLETLDLVSGTHERINAIKYNRFKIEGEGKLIKSFADLELLSSL